FHVTGVQTCALPISYSSVSFVGHATGRRSCRQVSIFIQRYSTHRSKFLVCFGNTGNGTFANIHIMKCCSASFFFLYSSLQLIPTLLRKEIRFRDSVTSVGRGKLRCAPAHHHHVFGFFHHRSCCVDWIFDIANTCHGTCLQRLSVHDGSIQLVLAVIGKYSSLSSIE